MEHPTEKVPIVPREVTAATFTGVELGADTVTLTPEYAGVDYFKLADPFDPSSARDTESTVAKDRRDWGSWPESFVDFQYETGLSSY